MRPEGLPAFIVRTLLWLPACFAAWYVSAPGPASVAGFLARALLGALQPGLVTALEHPGRDLVFVTRIEVQTAPGVGGLVLVEVNALLYTYGLALFAALMLASRAKLRWLLAGALALLPFQAFGIAFDFLVQAGIKLGPAVAAQVGLPGWQREAVALGYQMGSLIFPTLIPVVLWAAFSKPFLERALLARKSRPLGGG